MSKDAIAPAPPPERIESFSRCIDWYAEGETRVIEVDGVKIMVRFVGRHGRRARIAITAPPGAVFYAADEQP
jgi:hypothetical protein